MSAMACSTRYSEAQVKRYEYVVDELPPLHTTPRCSKGDAARLAVLSVHRIGLLHRNGSTRATAAVGQLRRRAHGAGKQWSETGQARPDAKCIIGSVDPKALRQAFKGDAVA
jgi:hypothetical protein